MKVNLVLSMRLAQALAGLVAFNVSGNLHIEGAGHVDDSRTIWPIVTSTPPGGRNVVRFCFTTLEAKAELEHDFLQAIDNWMDALGGPASSRTGHNLVFKEVRTPEGEDTVCCSEWKLPPAQNPCTWNAEVENDVLAVYMNPSGKANSATIGYVSDSDALLNNFPPQRHFVNLKPLNSNINVLWEWVHELGHVLGLLHEHGRIDRDNHVIFRCRNLLDFQSCFAAAKKDRDEQDTGDTDAEIEKKLCEQWTFANRYGFSARSFMKGTGSQPHVDPASWGAYDRDSIMHYSSLISSYKPEFGGRSAD
ncbi:hypothetical protein GRF29_69g882549 [Pseudopithomyces chartarum]|uniref:Peptidase M12A domain-containing protein n=1 Tax=Pseudopithomyces chartarum TaxID=1892770 RepID=A0AAN6LXP7_9PLEO|nr:hypothetical protein GRF29_69g882549 [Pseudopithomyces chartarum]